MINIVPAKPGDFPEVYALLCELEERTLPKSATLSVFEENLKSPHIHYLLAVCNNKIIGFGSIHIQHLLHHYGKVGEVQELIITNDYQRNGVGDVLWNALKNVALQNGCNLLEVCCNRQRERSHPFYEKNGMKCSHYKFTLEPNAERPLI